MKLTLEIVARDLATQADNLEITDQIARHAAAGNSSNAGSLMAVRAVLAVLLKTYPIDLAKARAWIESEYPSPLHKPLRESAARVIDSLASDLTGE